MRSEDKKLLHILTSLALELRDSEIHDITQIGTDFLKTFKKGKQSNDHLFQNE